MFAPWKNRCEHCLAIILAEALTTVWYNFAQPGLSQILLFQLLEAGNILGCLSCRRVQAKMSKLKRKLKALEDNIDVDIPDFISVYTKEGHNA